jgi:hypothetical protein
MGLGSGVRNLGSEKNLFRIRNTGYNMQGKVRENLIEVFIRICTVIFDGG